MLVGWPVGKTRCLEISGTGIQHDPAVVARETNVDEVAATINGIGRGRGGLDVGAVLERENGSRVSTVVRCIGRVGGGSAGIAFEAATHEVQWPTKLKRGDCATLLFGLIELEVTTMEFHGEITSDRSGRNPAAIGRGIAFEETVKDETPARLCTQAQATAFLFGGVVDEIAAPEDRESCGHGTTAKLKLGAVGDGAGCDDAPTLQFNSAAVCAALGTCEDRLRDDHRTIREDAAAGGGCVGRRCGAFKAAVVDRQRLLVGGGTDIDTSARIQEITILDQPRGRDDRKADARASTGTIKDRVRDSDLATTGVDAATISGRFKKLVVVDEVALIDGQGAVAAVDDVTPQQTV